MIAVTAWEKTGLIRAGPTTTLGSDDLEELKEMADKAFESMLKKAMKEVLLEQAEEMEEDDG